MTSAEDGPEVEPPPIVPGPAHDLSTDELLAAVVLDLTAQRGDEEPPLHHLVTLHERPTRLVYERAAGLARSHDEALQVVGLQILRELGPAPRPVSGSRTFRAEAVGEIEAVLAAATSPEVIKWAISALGYHQAQQSLDLVVRFRGHPDHRVRFAVAAALPRLVDPSAVPNEVVGAFEDLMVDPDADVRYYAAVGAIEELELLQRLSSETLAAAAEDSDRQVAQFVREALLPGQHSQVSAPKVALHAVVRHDEYVADIASAIYVVAVLPSRYEAEREIERLNRLKAAKRSRYFYSPARFYPEGRGVIEEQAPLATRDEDDEPYKWWAASLRIMSEALTAEQITERLGIEPSAVSTGRPVLDDKAETSRRWTVWRLESEMTRDTPLDEQLQVLLDRIELHASAVRSLRAEGCTVEFFTGFASSNGQGGVTLAPALLGRISELGAELSLDLYPPP